MGDKNGRRLSEVPVFEISNILGNDPLVTQNWEILAHGLNLGGATIHQNIKPFFSSENSSVLAFVRLLTIWIGMSGRSATTVGNLRSSLLRTREFTDAAERISEKFSDDQTIVTVFENVMDDVETETEDVHILSKPHGVKILEISQEERNLVIHTQKMMGLLELARNKNVVIISINGRQRSGKSFMLNLFRKYLQFGYNKPGVDWISHKLENPFEWGGSMARITSGIEVLSEPTVINANGEEIAVYLMDTQGLFDNKTEMQDNILIFAFSLLVSSVTIFNDKVHSEDVLQFLQVFLEFAKITASEDGSKNPNFNFQRLIFLLRDWPHEEEFQYGHYDDNECPSGQISNLKQRFLNTNDSTLSAQAVKTRQDVVSSFQKISFFASPHPNQSCKILDADNTAKWDTEFRNSLTEFVTRTLSPESIAASVKTIGNVKQTGGTLSTYVEVWANIIQSPDGLPAFSSLLDATIKLHYESIIDNLIKTYRSDLEAFIIQKPEGVSGDDFASHHESTKQKCLALFDKFSSVGGEDSKAPYLVNLESALESERELWKQINDLNFEKERQRQLAEEQRLEAEMVKNVAIQQAENHYNDACASLARAREKLEFVHANRESYTRLETKEVKERHRVLGVMVSPTYRNEQRVVFDQGKFDTAVNEAKQEVNWWEEKVRTSEANLNAMHSKLSKN